MENLWTRFSSILKRQTKTTKKSKTRLTAATRVKQQQTKKITREYLVACFVFRREECPLAPSADMFVSLICSTSFDSRTRFRSSSVLLEHHQVCWTCIVGWARDKVGPSSPSAKQQIAGISLVCLLPNQRARQAERLPSLQTTRVYVPTFAVAQRLEERHCEAQSCNWPRVASIGGLCHGALQTKIFFWREGFRGLPSLKLPHRLPLEACVKVFRGEAIIGLLLYPTSLISSLLKMSVRYHLAAYGIRLHGVQPRSLIYKR